MHRTQRLRNMMCNNNTQTECEHQNKRNMQPHVTQYRKINKLPDTSITIFTIPLVNTTIFTNKMN